MKTTALFIATIVLAFFLGLLLPWWSVAIAGFVCSLVFDLRPLVSFATVVAAISLLWTVMCIYISVSNVGLLAGKIATLIPLGGSVAALIAITALLGSITAGLAALSAAYLRSGATE